MLLQPLHTVTFNSLAAHEWPRSTRRQVLYPDTGVPAPLPPRMAPLSFLGQQTSMLTTSLLSFGLDGREDWEKTCYHGGRERVRIRLTALRHKTLMLWRLSSFHILHLHTYHPSTLHIGFAFHVLYQLALLVRNRSLLHLTQLLVVE